jgi:hypothetical protein
LRRVHNAEVRHNLEIIWEIAPDLFRGCSGVRDLELRITFVDRAEEWEIEARKIRGSKLQGARYSIARELRVLAFEGQLMPSFADLGELCGCT